MFKINADFYFSLSIWFLSPNGLPLHFTLTVKMRELDNDYSFQFQKKYMFDFGLQAFILSVQIQ